MKIRLVSDVHLEFLDDNRPSNVINYWHAVLPPLPDDAESILVIAGDLCVIGDAYLRRLQEILSDACDRFMKVVYVFGNHEYYHQTYYSTYDRLDLLPIANSDKLMFTSDRVLSLPLPNGLWFHAVTLWTDFNKKDWASMNAADQYMNDYRVIRTRDGEKHLISPLFTLNKHMEAVEELKLAIKPNSIVVTHHLPSRIAVHDKFKGNPQAELLNGAYASSLEDLILDTKPQAWMFGHTHTSFDGMIGSTRLMTNPVGYLTHGGPENKQYNPSFCYEATVNAME